MAGKKKKTASPGRCKSGDKLGLSTKTTIALIVIVFLAAVGGTMVFYTLHSIVHVQEFEASFKIVEPGGNIGFNVDPNLYFGKVPQGGSSIVKTMNLGNRFDFPVFVFIETEGDIADYLRVEENGFVLQPKETRELKLTITADPSDTMGNYTGNVRVVYKRV